VKVNVGKRFCGGTNGKSQAVKKMECLKGTGPTYGAKNERTGGRGAGDHETHNVAPRKTAARKDTTERKEDGLG